MKELIKLYIHYISISIKSQIQYRASFIMMVIGNFVVSFIEIIAIWAMFQRFGSMMTWNFAEVALFYGMINVSFAFAESFGRGFDIFPNMVKSGNFDRILLRPRSTTFQIAASELQVMRIGRFTQGFIVLIVGATQLNVQWDLVRLMLLIFSVIGGAFLFYGLFVIYATLAFWTTETLEIMNTMTYGGNETGQYPLSIYKKWFRHFFTFVVPLACANYFPAMAIIGKQDPLGSPLWFQYCSPLVCILFMFLSLRIWNLGVKHYRSTGS